MTDVTTLRERLEQQANHLEAVLQHYDVPVRVTGGLVFPGLVAYRVAPNGSRRIQYNEIADRVGEMTSSLWAECRCYQRTGGGAMIHVARHDPQPVELLPLQGKLVQRARLTTPYTVVVGITYDGSPLMINLASPQVGHLLVAQTNGNGNEILRSVVTSLSMNNRRNRLGFVFVDSSRKAFGPLAGLPHLLRPVLSDAEETSRVLQTLTQEMGRRNGNKDPHIVVAIDDLMNLPLDAWRAMVQLVEGGNEAGIHVVAHLKKLPDEPRVNGLLKYQFPVRLLGQMSTTVAREGYAKLLQNDAFSVIVNGQERTRVCIASIAPRQQALVTCEILKRALIESQPGRVVARPAPREEIEVIRSPELRDLPYACGLLWKFGRYQVDRLLDHLLAKLSAKVAAAQGAR